MARYANLSRDELVARLAQLEGGAASPLRRSKHKADQAPFQFHAHPTRHIAILVAYHGWPYSGLAIQPTIGYPTVEGELLKALEKTRLVAAGGGWEACEFSRCGRTDRGVSGEGQVLNLWVRSNRFVGDGGHELGDSWRPPTEDKVKRTKPGADGAAGAEGDGAASPSAPPKTPPKPPPAELNYPRLLNQVLPPAIRVLAWSPVAADFDARFSCSYRHYKYAFHRHAVAGAPPLDLELMNAGAALLLGEHDFRNFCRLDGSKQIENHSRCVLKAYFEPGPMPDQVVFNLIGTAFLWHQVRHIIAVLFLIGQGLEPPSLVTDLLDVQRFPGKPQYAMGDPLPLTLHECGYPAAAGLDWRFGPYDGPWQSLPAGSAARAQVRAQAELGRDLLERQLDAARQAAETQAWQVGGALRQIRAVLGGEDDADAATTPDTTFYPTGAGEHVATRRYQPVVTRPMAEGPDVVNAKWLESKAKKDEEKEKAAAAAAASASAQGEQAK